MASSETSANNAAAVKDPASPQLSAEWVKTAAESIGISGSSVDETGCFKYVADDVTFRVKSLIQDAVKMALHCKRTKLTTQDIDYTLKMNNYEPLYGFTSADYIPFRNASGGGRQLHFLDDKELDLDEISAKPLPKIPLQTSLKAHWLAIEGVQPAIPENPPPVAKDLQKLESINPVVKSTGEKLGKPVDPKSVKGKRILKDVKLKPHTEHDLSVEQQLYYKEVTEACVGTDEVRRPEALTSLAQDPGLHKMLPRLSTFIYEGVKVNCVNSNLAILIYLMRMTKSLLENSSLYLEKYLHELLPSVITCIVSRQLCLKPESDNHWALRDFASKILGQMCKKFSSNTNDIQTRVVKILSEGLHDPSATLFTHYGCIMALGELGPGVVQSFIIPIVRSEGDRLRSILDTQPVNPIDKVSCNQIKAAFIKSLAPALRVLRRPPDRLDAYRQEFGYLGAYIHEAVVHLRNQTAGGSSSGVAAGTSLLQQYTSASNSAPGGARVMSSNLMGIPPMPYFSNRFRKFPHSSLPPIRSSHPSSHHRSFPPHQSSFPSHPHMSPRSYFHYAPYPSRRSGSASYPPAMLSTPAPYTHSFPSSPLPVAGEYPGSRPSPFPDSSLSNLHSRQHFEADSVTDSSHVRTQNTMVLTHGSVSGSSTAGVGRSFSLPIGGRGVAGVRNPVSTNPPSPLIRISSGTSLVRTPSTPTTPGSTPGLQRFLPMSTPLSSSAPGGSSQQQSIPSGTTIVKVVSASSATSAAFSSRQTVTSKPPHTDSIQSAAAGDQTPNLLATFDTSPPT